MKKFLLTGWLFVCLFSADAQDVIQFVFTSDLHYGITRKKFRGSENTDAHIVNAAMVEKINSLPAISLPNDGGVNAGKKVRAIDGIIVTGDIANRMEPPYQSAETSWKQFVQDYMEGVSIIDKDQHKSKLYLVAGNHDASNAIGYYKTMQPLLDASSMAGIYNLMFHPSVPKTKDSYDYSKDKINYSKDMGGVHFVFINIWPDSAARVWMEKDLLSISNTTPIILFAHDPPEGDPKHFTNPNGLHDINATDKFENLLPEIYKDDQYATAINDHIEQRGFVQFIKNHPNIKAYFHGHSNGNEYYDYTGPDHNISLHTFRVDSPMKGKPSATDETKLSFQLISVDTKSKMMTVRECLWNSDPLQPLMPVQWGSSITVSLK